MEATVREYNAAHGIKQCVIPPPVIDELRAAGREVGRELGRAQQPAASTIAAPQISYSSPVKNMRAAEQIATELEHLEGEELRERTCRMRDLITTTNQEQKAATEQQGPVVSKSSRATGVNKPNAPPRQHRQAFSP